MKIYQLAAALILSLLFWEAVLQITDKTVSYSVENQCYYTQPVNLTIRKLWFEEGFSIYPIQNSYFGTYGRIEPGKKHVLIIGDSFTQAHEVMPESSFISLLNKNYPSINFINAGREGVNIADYIACKDYYENVSPDLYIFQLRISDFSESLNNNSMHYFETNNKNLEIKSGKADLFSVNLRKKYKTIASIFDFLQLPKFILRNNDLQAKDDNYVQAINITDNSYDDQLKLLKSTFKKKIVIFFIPEAPLVLEGNISYGDDSYARAKKNILFYANANDIDVIDLSESFVSYYNTTKQLPFGFNNGLPGTGHMNNAGHLIAAQQIIDYFEKTGALK